MHYDMCACFKFWPMKNIFPETISQWEFDYDLFENLPRIIVACNFSLISLNIKVTVDRRQQKKYYLSWLYISSLNYPSHPKH